MEREEAIEVIRKNYPHVGSSGTEFETALRELIPELKESEDERIRQAIIAVVQWAECFNASSVTHEAAETMLDWLEKQKEQKPFSQEVFDAAKHEALWGEQKPAEWSKDYREEDLRTRFAFYTYKDEDDVLYLSNVFVEETSRNKGFGTKILAAAEKVAETLGVIIIRLKVKQNSPANAWYRKHGYGFMAFEGDYDWLEKTLEYMKPVKQEWSEEDERMLEPIISDLRELCNCETDEELISDYEDRIAWLESLRPQSYWKPSEEQMKMLESLPGLLRDFKLDTSAQVLEVLREQLKKL